jgi:hypothetical protein
MARLMGGLHRRRRRTTFQVLAAMDNSNDNSSDRVLGALGPTRRPVEVLLVITVAVRGGVRVVISDYDDQAEHRIFGMFGDTGYLLMDNYCVLLLYYYYYFFGF